MKRMIIAGRDPNKDYNTIRFSGWTKSCTHLRQHIRRVKNNFNNKAAKDELIRYVRYSISEAEDAANKLKEYQAILEEFNSSTKSASDLTKLDQQLASFKFTS